MARDLAFKGIKMGGNFRPQILTKSRPMWAHNPARRPTSDTQRPRNSQIHETLTSATTAPHHYSSRQVAKLISNMRTVDSRSNLFRINVLIWICKGPPGQTSLPKIWSHDWSVRTGQVDNWTSGGDLSIAPIFGLLSEEWFLNCRHRQMSCSDN